MGLKAESGLSWRTSWVLVSRGGLVTKLLYCVLLLNTSFFRLNAGLVPNLEMSLIGSNLADFRIMKSD